MAFTRVNKDMGIISALADKPNDTNGLSAAQLKAKFDEGGAALKTYLNDTLLSELEGTSAAGNIGIDTINGIVATTVQAALEALKTAIDNVVAGGLTPGIVGTTELANGAVTTDKLAANCVTAAKIKNGEVKSNELANGAVITDKLDNEAVTTDKIGLAAVTKAKMASGAIGTNQLDTSDLLVPIECGGTGANTAANALSELGAQSKIQREKFSLKESLWTESGNGWEQTVAVTGMVSGGDFICSPSNAGSWDRAGRANLKTPTAGNGIMTFTCDTKPNAAISVTVYFW